LANQLKHQFNFASGGFTLCRSRAFEGQTSAQRSIAMEEKAQDDAENFNNLMGPPPVLSSENREAYDALMKHFVECFAPQDFMGRLLVKDLVDSVWEEIRLKRHKALLVERTRFKIAKIRVRHGIQSRPKNVSAEEVSTAEQERAYTLESKIQSVVTDVDEVLNQVPSELDDARSLQHGIGYYIQLDTLQNAKWAQRNLTLEQIALYNEVRKQKSSQASATLIDGECAEVAKGDTPKEDVPKQDVAQEQVPVVPDDKPA
jgi:hypothetical protein